jgi:hypothetical protein
MSEFLLWSFALTIGWIVPGYLLARLLGSRAAWACAVPLSMVILLAGVMVLDATGVPLRFAPALAWELAVIALLALASWRWRWRWRGREPAPDAAPEPISEPDGAGAHPLLIGSRRLLIAGVAVVASLAVVRGYLAPLAGPDVGVRWGFLPLQMLRLETLAFYPPGSAEDFRIYFYPDGFAPLVSSSIWWIYAAIGRESPIAVSPLAILQYLSALGFAWSIGRRLYSPRAGLLAVAVLAATPLFLRSVLIGQETGVTALAAAGMVYALVDPEEIGLRAALLAGAFAGVGALAREYGAALLACGAFVLIWRRAGWRLLAIFVATGLLLWLPWLVRNTVRCGNPLYNHSLGFLPVNAVFAGIMAHWLTLFGLGTYGAAKWWALARLLTLEAGTALAAGVAGALYLFRRHGYLLLGAAVSVVLWLLSVGYTSGGVNWSMRVLTPALVLLAVAAGVAVAQWERRGRALPGVVNLAMLPLLLHGAAWAAVFPEQPTFFEWRWSDVHVLERTEEVVPEGGIERLMVDVLPPGTRILGYSPRPHALLTNMGADLELVPVWSPEVAFLFDQDMAPEEQRLRLRGRNIDAALICADPAYTDFCMARSPYYAAFSRRWELRGALDEICWLFVLP